MRVTLSRVRDVLFRKTKTNLPSSIAPRCQPAKLCASMDVDIHDDLANHSEIAIAHALLKHSVVIILPSDYTPHGIVPKDGEIRVTKIQAKKISKHKAVLVVKFLAPASLKDTEIQLFCTSLEPKTLLGQGADLTLLTAIRKTHPHAKTLHDIGVRQCLMQTPDESCSPTLPIAAAIGHVDHLLTSEKHLLLTQQRRCFLASTVWAEAPFSTQHR